MNLPSDESCAFESYDYDPFDPFEEAQRQAQAAGENDAREHALACDTRTPRERIEYLLSRMPTRRHVLLGIMRMTGDPMSTAAIDGYVSDIQRCDTSVYGTGSYLTLLEEAGAVARCDEQGNLLDADSKRSPRIVEIDGERFYQPLGFDVTHWVLTFDGRSVLDADDPLSRLLGLVDADGGRYEPIYLRILKACDCADGKGAAALNDLVNDDPVLQDPRWYAPRFTDKLASCEALKWQGAWVTTDIGRQAAAELERRLAESEE